MRNMNAPLAATVATALLLGAGCGGNRLTASVSPHEQATHVAADPHIRNCGEFFGTDLAPTYDKNDPNYSPLTDPNELLKAEQSGGSNPGKHLVRLSLGDLVCYTQVDGRREQRLTTAAGALVAMRAGQIARQRLAAKAATN